MEKETNNNTFHLDDLQLARAAEALNNGHYDGFKSKIKSHLEECESCSNNLMELMDVLTSAEVDEPQTHSISPAKSTTPKIRSWLVAASIAVALLTSTWAWYSQMNYNSVEGDFHNLSHFSDSITVLEKKISQQEVRHRKQEKRFHQNAGQKSDSIKNLEEELFDAKETIASLYLPNAALEEEMLLVLRSGSVKLTSPNKSKFYKKNKPLFQWGSGPEKLNFVVYNNQAVVVKTVKSVKRGYQLSLHDFNFGTYYFELYSGRDLMVLKKFEVHPEN